MHIVPPEVPNELQLLRDQTNDLRAILDSSYDEIFVTDGNGVTIMVNQSCERLYGMAASELIGQSVHDLEQRGIFQPSATAVALRERRRVTILQRTRSGRHVLVTANPIFHGGTISRVVCNSRDVTELLELREQLSEAEGMAKRYRTELARLRTERLALEERSGPQVTPGLAGVIQTARRIARVDSTVLLLGESGVGKDVLASLIHEHSPRRDGPLVKLNCGAIPPELLESELFGYEPGAFTGARKEGRTGHIELAHGGTLFLNEVGELPPAMQVKLLQVLQDRQCQRVGGNKPVAVDIRIIAATNRNLQAMVAAGDFRADLFYRLNVVPIKTPPLRERPEDIPVLAEHFRKRCNTKYGLQCEYAPGVVQALACHNWPGNVRELENVVERMVVLAEGNLIRPTDVIAILTPGAPAEAQQTIRPLKQALEQTEGALVRAAYAEYRNTYQIARALGISQPSAVRKVQKYVRDSVVHDDSSLNH